MLQTHYSTEEVFGYFEFYFLNHIEKLCWMMLDLVWLVKNWASKFFKKQICKKQHNLDSFKKGSIKCNCFSGIMFLNIFHLYLHFTITKFTLNNQAIANEP